MKKSVIAGISAAAAVTLGSTVLIIAQKNAVNATEAGKTQNETTVETTVEAQENPPSLTFANKFYEVQKYSSIDEHVHNFLAFLINDNKFKSLSADNQKILQEEAKNFVKEQRAMELKDNEKAIKDLETIGKLKTNILTADQKAAMRAALQPMYDKYEAKFGKAIFDLCAKYNK